MASLPRPHAPLGYPALRIPRVARDLRSPSLHRQVGRAAAAAAADDDDNVGDEMQLKLHNKVKLGYIIVGLYNIVIL